MRSSLLLLTFLWQLTSSSSASPAGGRDIHFVYAYIVYQLLRYRIQRDLLLVSALLNTQPTTKPAPGKAEVVDARLYPAVVKLYDTVLQSLNQMRTLSVVDDNPDLASAVDARVSFTKARRCVNGTAMPFKYSKLCYRCIYLARCYIPVKKFGEALSLLQLATIHIRETNSSLSLSNSESVTDAHPDFFPLDSTEVKDLEETITSNSTRYKRDWLAYNGGSTTRDPKEYKKPLFFDVALNYVELDTDRLLERAGKAPATPAPVIAAPKPVRAEAAPDRKAPAKANLVEDSRPSTPQPTASAKGGLSSLLGGWWGRS